MRVSGGLAIFSHDSQILVRTPAEPNECISASLSALYRVQSLDSLFINRGAACH